MDDFNFEFENKKKKKIKKEPLFILICIICFVVGGIGGYFIHGTKETNTNLEGTVFDQIGEIVDNDFVDTADSQYSMNERLLMGMVAGLQDPYSAYMNQQQSLDLETSINGSFQGIGVTYTAVEEKGALLLNVYQNTPAAKAGLLAGDIITHIEGTSIADYTSEKIKNAIQGENGSNVFLKILRDGKSKEISVKRGSVETSVASELRTTVSQKIGYLSITTFGEGTSIMIEDALKTFQKENVKNLVIDLRDNGGGYLQAAQDILDLFIKKDEILFRTQSKQGKEEVYKATDREKYNFENGYILVNHDSASASEVVTSALQEVLGYKVIGETTYGKGVVQTQKTLSDGSILKYTHAKWLTSKGEWINEIGIKPDYEIDTTTIHDFGLAKMEKTYHYDEVDSNIKYMQEILKELGYDVDRQDGYFSKKTENALKTFENAYQLKDDGQYDKNDSLILLSALAYHVYQKLDDKCYQKVIELMK
ncbi:S41 family peptidase [Candidatus Stoquefichus massiliensis]|uniref:S41 family peptidase n=1 Tax=Candidatus Stoquefichus massiliensis TaxID=1470350 RepID=UPI000487F763|nr:S41 family peptidase [Candidatus Stoquefichus massiliensis]